MVSKKSELNTDVVFGKFGGSGKVEMTSLISSPDDLYGKGRLFSVACLEKDGVFGIHTHHDEEEFYLILEGKGNYYDNGTWVEVNPGDVTLCRDGESHGITNIGEGDLKYIALILYK